MAKFRIIEIQEGQKSWWSAQISFLWFFWVTIEYTGSLPNSTFLWVNISKFSEKSDAEFVINDRINYINRKKIIHDYGNKK